MKTKHDTAFSGIWAVAWRSFVLLPVGLAAFLLPICLIAALLFPPVIGAAYLSCGLWWQGIPAFVVWSLVIWSWRHFRLSRIFESPPSLL